MYKRGKKKRGGLLTMRDFKMTEKTTKKIGDKVRGKEGTV